MTGPSGHRQRIPRSKESTLMTPPTPRAAIPPRREDPSIDRDRLNQLVTDYETQVIRVAEQDAEPGSINHCRCDRLGRQIAAMLGDKHLSDIASKVRLKMVQADTTLLDTDWWWQFADPHRAQLDSSVACSGFPRADLRIALDQYEELFELRRSVPAPCHAPVDAQITAVGDRIASMLDRPLWTGSERVLVQCRLNDITQAPTVPGELTLFLPSAEAIDRHFTDSSTQAAASPVGRGCNLHDMLRLYQVLSVAAAEANAHTRARAAQMLPRHRHTITRQIDTASQLGAAEKAVMRSTMASIELNPRALIPDPPDELSEHPVTAATHATADGLPVAPAAGLMIPTGGEQQRWLIVGPENGIWVARTYLDDREDPGRTIRDALIAFTTTSEAIQSLTSGATYFDRRTGTQRTLSALPIPPVLRPWIDRVGQSLTTSSPTLPPHNASAATTTSTTAGAAGTAERRRALLRRPTLPARQITTPDTRRPRR
ncbi:hypothetical protein [Nocardia gipuzkoensis]|uniref:hypothetical protein n=1 Tax=Nocardia gipuzkoensis TaxID=2749991 RepID=UPI00237D3A0A|nr:hypothetical protein [Nocardia gipuzkoensis]MDE1672660.1 hypothetical protein [Nocardia gipuzkoensis]